MDRVPKALRIKLWTETFGVTLYGKCYCCDRDLKVDNFEAGHIVSEANGGKMTINNLKVLCKPCNGSCGTMNLEEFKESMTISPNSDVEKEHSTKIDISNKSAILDQITNPKERAILKISNFMKNLKTIDSLGLAITLLDSKRNGIQNELDKLLKNNPGITMTHSLGNIGNLLPNSHYSSILAYKLNPLSYKSNPGMAKYYDNWFIDVQYQLINYMNDENVVGIIDSVF